MGSIAWVVNGQVPGETVVINESGMTEMSSQLYDGVAGAATLASRNAGAAEAVNGVSM